RGEQAAAENYRNQSDLLRNDLAALLNLVLQEIALREQAGVTPVLEDYLARFPEIAADLRKQFAVRRIVQTAAWKSPLEFPPTTTTAHTTTPQLPGLEMLNFVAGGGQADVYRARETRLDRIVAVKVMRPEACRDARHRARFRREGRAVARLDHPNTVRVFSCNE